MTDLETMKRFRDTNPPGVAERNQDGSAEIVTHYYGARNPIDKSCSWRQLANCPDSYFEVRYACLQCFPAYGLSFPVPRKAPRWLDRNFGLMKHAFVTKPCVELRQY